MVISSATSTAVLAKCAKLDFIEFNDHQFDTSVTHTQTYKVAEVVSQCYFSGISLSSSSVLESK